MYDNISLLSAHKRPICYYDCLSFAYSKLNLIPDFDFMQFVKYSILMI